MSERGMEEGRRSMHACDMFKVGQSRLSRGTMNALYVYERLLLLDYIYIPIHIHVSQLLLAT